MSFHDLQDDNIDDVLFSQNNKYCTLPSKLDDYDTSFGESNNYNKQMNQSPSNNNR